MNENQFVVDLGNLKLTEEQRKKLNTAIHKAVAGELADIGTARQVALFPINDLPKDIRDTIFGTGGGIINGIIIRDIRTNDIRNLLNSPGVGDGGI